MTDPEHSGDVPKDDITDQDAMDAFVTELQRLEEKEIANPKPKRKATAKQKEAGMRNLERAREARKKRAEAKKKVQQYPIQAEEQEPEYEYEQDDGELELRRRPARRKAAPPQQPVYEPYYDDTDVKNELKELKRWMMLVAKETRKSQPKQQEHAQTKAPEPVKDSLAEAYKNKLLKY
jgi:hypothetical protein